VEKYSTDIIADEMQMLGGRDGDGGSGYQERAPRQQAPARAPAAATPPAAAAMADDFSDDDIPF